MPNQIHKLVQHRMGKMGRQNVVSIGRPDFGIRATPHRPALSMTNGMKVLTIDRSIDNTFIPFVISLTNRFRASRIGFGGILPIGRAVSVLMGLGFLYRILLTAALKVYRLRPVLRF